MDLKTLMPFSRTNLQRTAEGDPLFSLRRELDRMFDDFTRGFGLGLQRPDVESGYLVPRMDVAETDKGLELTAEIPGIDPKDVSLDLSEGVLTLKAELATEKEEKDEKRHYHLIERRTGSFLRRLTLPFEPDADKIDAKFDHGVLRVTIPRSPKAEAETKKIPIKGD